MSKNASYDSTTTVAELLQSISEVIDQQVLRKIRESKCFFEENLLTCNICTF
jgi:hypothetical protein